MSETILVVYFFVWILLVLWSWIFMHGRDPKDKKVWYPRVSLVNLAVTFVFFLAASVAARSWPAIAVLVLVFAFFFRVGILKPRVRENCGKATQPRNLFIAAEFCPKCGEQLSPTQLFSKVR